MSAAPGQSQKTFRWEDPFDLAARLTDEERMIWETARQYAREKLMPRVVEAYAEEQRLPLCGYGSWTLKKRAKKN